MTMLCRHRLFVSFRKRLSVLPDEPLSRAEAQSLAERLDEVKNQLTEQLRKETADKDELRSRVDELTETSNS